MNNLKPHTINEIRNNLSETLSNIDFNKRNTSKKISQNNENKSQIYKNTLRHIYSTDQIVRRAKSLNNTTQANNKFIYVSKDVVDDSPNKKILEVKENDKLIKRSSLQIFLESYRKARFQIG